MIGNIQLLRAYAALGVVIYHLGFSFGKPHGADFYGVAVFFVISGFLMSSFAHEKPQFFLLKRLLRVAPLYWLGTLSTVALFGGFAWHSWSDVLLSLAFIPHISDQGSWQPTLGVGWTLVLEMGFYSIFAICIALFGRGAPAAAAVVLIAVFTIARSFEGGGALQTYAGVLYNLHFVVGIALFYLFRAVTVQRALPSSLWMMLLPLACLVAWVSLNQAEFLSASYYVQAYVAPSALVAAAIVLARLGADVRAPPLLAVGDASYAIYILHTIGIEYLRQRGIVLADTIFGAVSFLAALIVASMVIHQVIERPIHRATRRLVQRLSQSSNAQRDGHDGGSVPAPRMRRQLP